METIIKNTTVYIGENFDRLDNVDILIEKDTIKKIGKGIRAEKAKKFDGKDFFITPGFVNSHFHPSQQSNRALGVGLSHDKQMDLLHACDKTKKPEDKYWLSYMAVIEGLKAGTTCFYSVGSEIDTQIKIYNNLGVRAACTLILKDIESREKKKNVRAETFGTKEILTKAEELHKKYHDDLVRIHFGAVNVRYCSDNLILGMQELAKKYDVYFHMHAAEGDDYVESVKKRTGHTPVEHLYKIGALNNRVSLAHMTKLTKKEIKYLAETGAHVVHCPRANSYVAVGVCPVKELLDAGVNVALGSDAAINNNSNEVRGDARAAFDKIADKYERADLVDYKTLFRMLTINGAKAMGLEDGIGTIEQGKKADLVLWCKNDYPFIPGFNLIADLIFTESCLAHTIFINGQKVLENYKVVKMDEEELKRKSREVADRYFNLFKKEVSKNL
ncbi:MAG: amidohydrolase family protein [Nanoarchaeota archaeon]|nr:amidohydrolase family protein [Nanoarchaeota archaeon]